MEIENGLQWREEKKKWIISHAHFKSAPELAESPEKRRNHYRIVSYRIMTKTVHESEHEMGAFWICSWSTLDGMVWAVLSFLFSIRPTWFSSIRLIVLFKQLLKRIRSIKMQIPNKTKKQAVYKMSKMSVHMFCCLIISPSIFISINCWDKKWQHLNLSSYAVVSTDFS